MNTEIKKTYRKSSRPDQGLSDLVRHFHLQLDPLSKTLRETKPTHKPSQSLTPHLRRTHVGLSVPIPSNPTITVEHDQQSIETSEVKKYLSPEQEGIIISHIRLRHGAKELAKDSTFKNSFNTPEQKSLKDKAEKMLAESVFASETAKQFFIRFTLAVHEPLILRRGRETHYKDEGQLADLVQEESIRVSRALDSYLNISNPKVTFSTFARVAINNNINDILDKEKAAMRRAVKFESLEDLSENKDMYGNPTEMIAGATTDEKALAEMVFAPEIWQDIKAIIKEDTLLLQLQCLGFSSLEIAAMTHLQPGNVKEKISRSKKKLQDPQYSSLFNH